MPRQISVYDCKKLGAETEIPRPLAETTVHQVNVPWRSPTLNNLLFTFKLSVALRLFLTKLNVLNCVEVTLFILVKLILKAEKSAGPRIVNGQGKQVECRCLIIETQTNVIFAEVMTNDLARIIKRESMSSI